MTQQPLLAWALVALMVFTVATSMGEASTSTEASVVTEARVVGVLASPVHTGITLEGYIEVDPQDLDDPVHAEFSHRIGKTTDGGPEPLLPCTDPAGCPDLIVEEEDMRSTAALHNRNFAANSCSVQEGSAQPGARKLLRFTFTTPNVGDGDLIVGAPADHPEWFEWGQCHGHWHFREYADYRLWTVDGYTQWQAFRAMDPSASVSQVFEDHPELLDGFVSGHKQGFCVIDIVPLYHPLLWPVVGGEWPKYFDCETNQGITVGWADRYHWALDGQWVDVTGVPPGLYVLEAEVNPERFYAETDYGNNAAAVLVEMT